MLRPESSSKRPALTKKHGPPWVSGSAWQVAALPQVDTRDAGRFRVRRPWSSGCCCWLMRPSACLSAPWPAVAVACFCSSGLMTMTLAPAPCASHHHCRRGSPADWSFGNGVAAAQNPSWSAAAHIRLTTPAVRRYSSHLRGPGPSARRRDPCPSPTLRPIFTLSVHPGLGEMPNTILRRSCRSRPPAPTPLVGASHRRLPSAARSAQTPQTPGRACQGVPGT
jgi:hypothetical protein